MNNINEMYVSIYEYTGRSATLNNVGREVMDAALKEGIKVVWRDLPPDMKRENFTQVATYPRSFLNKFFGNDVKYTMIDPVTLNMLFDKLTSLEEKFNDLIKKLDNKQEEQLITKLDHVNTDDDELPF